MCQTQYSHRCSVPPCTRGRERLATFLMFKSYFVHETTITPLSYCNLIISSFSLPLLRLGGVFRIPSIWGDLLIYVWLCIFESAQTTFGASAFCKPGLHVIRISAQADVMHFPSSLSAAYKISWSRIRLAHKIPFSYSHNEYPFLHSNNICIKASK